MTLSHWSPILALFLLGVVFTACEPTAEPVPMQITASIAPETQWSGGPMTIRSPQLQGAADDHVVLTVQYHPHDWHIPDPYVPPTFFLDIERVADDQLSFMVPPMYSGSYEVRLAIHGFEPVSLQFGVVGLTQWPEGVLAHYTSTEHGLALPGGGVLAAAEVDYWDGPRGYVFVNLEPWAIEVVPGLEEDRDNNRVMMMYVPGPSFRPNHVVVDLSPDDSVAEVWKVGPTAGSFEHVASAPCGGGSGSERYTAAELSEGHCLILDGWEGRLVDNTGTVLAEDRGLRKGEIRLAPNGRWAVPVTGKGRIDFNDFELSGAIPVIASNGSAAYELTGYVELPDADFTAEGDTLFVIGARSVPGKDAREWSLDVLDAGTGTPFAAVAFADGARLSAVLVDPVRPLVYVGGHVGSHPNHTLYRTSFLAVLDRPTLNLIALVPAPEEASSFGGVLAFGGSSGRIHLLVSCGWDCGGLRDYAFDTK